MAVTADKVLAILTDYGVDAVFRAYASKSYDAATGQVSLGASTDHTHKIMPPYSPRRADLERFGRIDGVKQAEALSAVSAAGLVFGPAVGMELLYAGVTWLIVAVNPIRTAQEIVMYELALSAKAGG